MTLTGTHRARNGGSGGIGRAARLAFARAAADVVVKCATARAEAEALLVQMRSRGPRALTVQANVTGEAEVGRMETLVVADGRVFP